MPIPSCLAVSWAMAICIASYHLDLHAHLPGAGDGCFGLVARRIEQWQNADKQPFIFLICDR